ncbi:MAG: chemotaxis protein CheY [Segetibacter sp.]|nr:chemotaxis protein CheY [Segetibacter sp.]
MADDDLDDIQLTKDCFEDIKLPITLNEVSDGQYLIDRLKGAITSKTSFSELPQLILLDLNMPRKSGLEALKEIKEDKVLCKIPIVIFSTSKAPKDIEKAYQLGASCFVNKPNTLEEWCDKMGKLAHFWFDCVKVAV